MLEAGEANKRLRALVAPQNGAQRTGPPLGSADAVKSWKHACRYPGQPRAACTPGRTREEVGHRGSCHGQDPGCSQPHLCHLDHIGELSEAGDGDDIMVGPTLGPDRRKQHR